MIILTKTMPNGVTAIKHKLFNIEVAKEGENNYIVGINSYHTDDTSGPISWQDYYFITSSSCISSYQSMENFLVLDTSSPFSGGSVN